jgi:hypothetical protein
VGALVEEPVDIIVSSRRRDVRVPVRATLVSPMTGSRPIWSAAAAGVRTVCGLTTPTGYQIGRTRGPTIAPSTGLSTATS